MIYIPEGPRECKSLRDGLPSDVTNLYHGKSIELDLKIGTKSGPS